MPRQKGGNRKRTPNSCDIGSSEVAKRQAQHDIALIGAKRNAGCELARGEIICCFDDDDFSAPGRVADQVRRLEQSGKQVTGYHSARFTDGVRWWRYSGPPGYALGTSLCFRKSWWLRHRFLSIQVGEDYEFVELARAENAIVSVDAGDLMYATNHDGNSCRRELSGSRWQLEEK